MPKPTSTPRWANSGGAIVEPSSGKKDVGWVTAERPPAQYLNWLQNLTYNWLAWLDPLLTTNGGLQALVNEHVIVSGTGLFKHGTRTLEIPVIGIIEGSVAPNNERTMTSPNFTFIPFPQLPLGARIITVRVKILDSATGPTTLKARLRTIVGSASSSTSGDGSASAGSGVEQTIATATLNVTVATMTVYGVDVYFFSGSASSKIRGVEVDYDQP